MFWLKKTRHDHLEGTLTALTAGSCDASQAPLELDLVADKEVNGQNGVDWADTSQNKVFRNIYCNSVQ